MKNKYSDKDIQNFCKYFFKNPNDSYMQYAQNNLPKDMMLSEFMSQIDAIRKRLQREFILMSRKENGTDGLFYSVKNIDVRKLNKKYNLTM